MQYTDFVTCGMKCKTAEVVTYSDPELISVLFWLNGRGMQEEYQRNNWVTVQ